MMLNPRSPIVNMMGGGYVPPSTYSVGYNGYNGYGYNPNGNYYGFSQYGYYESPFQKMEREKREREEREALLRQDAERNKKIARIAAAYEGKEISEDELDAKYNPRSNQNLQRQAEDYLYQNVYYAVANAQNSQQQFDNAANEAQSKIKAYHDKFINPNANMVEFFNSAGNLLIDGLMREQKTKNKDLSQMYDSNAYKQRLGMNTNPYSNGFKNLDDMTIRLPDSIKQNMDATYEERRRKFIEAITSGH